MTIFWAFAGPFNGAYGFRPGGGHGSPALARTLGGRPWARAVGVGVWLGGLFLPRQVPWERPPLAPGHGPSGSGASLSSAQTVLRGRSPGVTPQRSASAS